MKPIPLFFLSLAACAGPAQTAQRAPAPAPLAAPAATDDPAAPAPDADALFQAKSYAEAVAAYEAARERGDAMSIQQRVRAAIAYEQLGDRGRAFVWLERALAGGANPAVLGKVVPPLAPLVADPRWQQLVDRHVPACELETRRQFDFWLGDWEVRDPAGNVAGTNVISRDVGGCALIENWTGATGGTGRSVNFYDPAAAGWKQVWTDDGGRVILYEGQRRDDGAMHFEGDLILPDGTVLRSRMTFTPEAPDRVRQVIDNSSDGGQTWQPWFDGVYVRRAAAAPSAE